LSLLRGDLGLEPFSVNLYRFPPKAGFCKAVEHVEPADRAEGAYRVDEENISKKGNSPVAACGNGFGVMTIPLSWRLR